MSDFIKYRLPNQKTIEQRGLFRRTIKDSKITKGFIVSPYRSKYCYVFESNETKKDNYHFGSSEISHYKFDEYEAKATKFLDSIIKKNIKKAVLSRTKELDFKISDAYSLFCYLEKKYPSAFIYLISSKCFGTWLGCSPELLLSVDFNDCQTVSLAGTKPVLSEEKWTHKEKDEQRYVTEFILNQLSDIQTGKINVLGPYPFDAGPVQHLKTDISFNIDQSTPMQIINAIHPTPAVSGFPQAEACELIENIESNDRELYTGYIGVLSEEKSSLFVNLRCCQLFLDKAVLYLGGGYTKDSNIKDEWDETEHKSKTLTSAIDFINDQ